MKRISLIICCIVCLSALFLLGCGGSGSEAMTDESSQQTEEANTDIHNDTGLISVKSYGALGDGSTDDTDAIQTAINSGDTIYFPKGTYLISRPIEISEKSSWSLYAQDASFDYSGDDYAFRISAAVNCNLEIGEIISKNGGGIAFISTDVNKWTQYVRLSFNYIECLSDCIYIRVSSGWSNENQVYGGRFAGGNNGVRIDYKGRDVINGWKFYNCGIEGVDNGFLLDAGKGYISNISIFNARYAETFNTILKTKGNVYECLWIGTHVIEPDMISCSEETRRFEIIAPIGENGHRGCINDGKLMIEKIEYEEASL